jgi:hypothetical protein
MNAHAAVAAGRDLSHFGSPRQRRDGAPMRRELRLQCAGAVEEPQHAPCGHGQQTAVVTEGQMLAPFTRLLDGSSLECARVPEPDRAILARGDECAAGLLPRDCQHTARMLADPAYARIRIDRHQQQCALPASHEECAAVGRPSRIDRIISQLDAGAKAQPLGHRTHAMQDSKPASNSRRSRWRPMNTNRLSRGTPGGQGRSSRPS